MPTTEERAEALAADMLWKRQVEAHAIMVAHIRRAIADTWEEATRESEGHPRLGSDAHKAVWGLRQVFMTKAKEVRNGHS